MIIEEDCLKMEEKSNRNSKSFESLMGKEYVGVKGQAAIDKLLEEKQGHVKGAFYRDDIGEIDLFWGDETAGLMHIISRRNRAGISGVKFSQELTDIIEKGNYFNSKKSDPNRYHVAYKHRVAVITFEIEREETTALWTAFHTRK